MNHAIKLLLSPVFADLEAGFFPTSVLPVSFVSFCATVRVVSAEPSALIVYVAAAPSMILYVTGAAMQALFLLFYVYLLRHNDHILLFLFRLSHKLHHYYRHNWYVF
ncbi:MAG: hypothetical protein ACLSGB_13005 [Dorea sp.]